MHLHYLLQNIGGFNNITTNVINEVLLWIRVKMADLDRATSLLFSQMKINEILVVVGLINLRKLLFNALPFFSVYLLLIKSA